MRTILKTTLMALFLLGLSACDLGTNPDNLAGVWTGAKEPYVKGTFLDVKYTFMPNEGDNTTGSFILQYKGKHEEEIQEGLTLSAAFTVIEKGKYSIADNQLTLTYMPDSVTCQANEDDIKAYVEKAKQAGKDEDFDFTLKTFNSFIADAFKQVFSDIKTETITIQLSPTNFSYEIEDGHKMNFTKSK